MGHPPWHIIAPCWARSSRPKERRARLRGQGGLGQCSWESGLPACPGLGCAAT